MAYVNIQRQIASRESVLHSHQVIGALETLLSTLKDSETGQRGYLLTAEPPYLEPFTAALNRVQAQTAEVGSLLGDNAEQAARFAQLLSVIDDKLAELRRTVALVQQGDTQSAIAIVRSDAGKALMDDVRGRVAAMQAVEEQLLLQRLADVRVRTGIMILSIVLTVIIGFVSVGGVFALVRHHGAERDRAAQEISEQRESLRVTLASIGDAVITTDTVGLVQGMNAVAEELTGWVLDDARGKPLETVFIIINESSREAVASPVRRALAEGRIVGLANHTVLIARDRRERTIEDSAAPIRSAAGEIVGCVLVFHDVTERTLADKRALESMAAAAEANAKFHALLAEANERKDEFLATLAHELRNPLAPIRTGLEVMRLSQGDQATVEQARAMMERQVGHMVRMVDDLLDVSRISRGSIELRKERVDLATLLQHALETSRPLIDTNAHELVIHLPSAPIIVMVDPTRVGQVFANILNNAARYTDRGGRIELSAEREGANVAVRVRDNGEGIAAADLHKIFELFTQVGRSTGRSQAGLGIGLSLASRLIGMHGGTIEVSSDGHGRGSEFVVRLPCVDSAAGAIENAAPASGGAPAVKARRILVADDNMDGAAALGTLFGFKGHDVRLAHDGEEAFATAEAFRPDVIVLDLGMPKADGFAVCRRIREQPWGRAPVIVALTGWGQASDKQRTEAAGFDGHLVKPADIADIEMLLTRLSS